MKILDRILDFLVDARTDPVVKMPEPRVQMRMRVDNTNTTEWRMFTIDELVKGFSIQDVRQCEYCGTFYTSIMSERNCVQCGAPLPDRVVRIVQKAVKAIAPETVVGHGVVQGTGMVWIRADDGDIQMEPFKIPLAENSLVTFNNTSNTFFVVRKSGRIIDIVVNGAAEAIFRIKVNGIDRGIALPGFRLQPTFSNRLACTIPVCAGAAMQIRVE